MKLFSRLRGEPLREPAHLLYTAAAEQSRMPVFYRDYGVADTLPGRYELLILHVILVLRRLRAVPDGPRLGQLVFDTMFADLDDALREEGVGDTGVGKRIRTMAEGFYGRLDSYDKALAPAAEPAVLEGALARNLFADQPVPQASLGAMAAYLQMVETDLAAQPDTALRAGRVGFPSVPAR
jgi:cytochrome b pre-mRNA-processing protein 3